MIVGKLRRPVQVKKCNRASERRNDFVQAIDRLEKILPAQTREAFIEAAFLFRLIELIYFPDLT
jgi:hypothetical protein